MDSSRDRRRNFKVQISIDWLIATAISVAALVVYALTLTPSLSYLSPDGSELATVPYVLGLAHSPGYPLYTWMGFLFSHLLPFGDVAHRINLMSAVLGALGVGGLYLVIVRILSPREVDAEQPSGEEPEVAQTRVSGDGHRFLEKNTPRAVAALAALMFAFSTDFWSQSVIAEVYAPNIALVALTLLALLHWERARRWIDFFLFALVFGLSLGMHLSDLGFAPAMALFVLLTIMEGKPGSARQESGLKRFLAKIKDFVVVALSGAVGFAVGAAQYTWLPLRASTLNDKFMLRSAPDTLRGLYRYTLGAFPQFKFAFRLIALPDRIVYYLEFIRRQFGLIGILIGLIGLLVLLMKRPRHYFLLVGMYLVHVWFFIQYRVFDLEVFFIPAHFLWSIFIAFGVWGLVEMAIILAGKVFTGGWKLNRALVITLLALLLLPATIPLTKNWERNDLSGDVAINDFYANTWELLPQGSALITRGGVFGYDTFYWQVVYDTRPDVNVPMLPGPDPDREDLVGVELYATTRSLQNNRGPGALPPDLIARDMWEVPVLVGEQPSALFGKRGQQMLVRLSSEPPSLVVRDPQPKITLNADLGPVTLMGADLDQTIIESGGIIQLTLYWLYEIAPSQAQVRIETVIGGRSIEQHEVGFGLLRRYINEVGMEPGDVIVDRYYLVVPSNTPEGMQQISVQQTSLAGVVGDEVVLGTLEIVNEEDTFERWLRIAKGEED